VGGSVSGACSCPRFPLLLRIASRRFHVHPYTWSMSKDGDYRRGRTCVFRIHARLVFVTKYRRGVRTGKHLDCLRSVFADVCQDFGATLAEMDGEDDHVHLLVEYPPTVQLSKLVNSLRGVSSRMLRAKYKVHTHRDHLWYPLVLRRILRWSAA
jgi:putative transposase